MRNVMLLVPLPIQPNCKGNHMKGHIDKIDVKNDHRELISLFYRIELQTLLMRLMYEHGEFSRLSTMD